MEYDFLKDNFFTRNAGLKYIVERLISNKSFLLYFLSPEVNIKAFMIKEWLDKNSFYVSEELNKNLKLLALDFRDEELLTSINMQVNEDTLMHIYAYYGKNKTLPNWLLNILLQESKEKRSSERVSFLINLLLTQYFLQDNNFDLVDTHIKYCIEYLNYNIDLNEYENMITYIICGKYLERTKDIFVSCAVNYYILAENSATLLNDEITLCSIFNYTSYYYHNTEEREKSISYANKALDLAKKLEIPEIYFNTYKILGIISNTLGDYKKASLYMESAIYYSEQSRSFSITENVKLKNSLGYLYFLKGNFRAALDVHLDCINTLAQANSTSEILDEAVKTFDNLSNSYRNLGDIDKAIYFADITTKIIQNCNFGNRINDIQNLCKQYTDLGLLYGLFKDDYESALNYYNLAKFNINNNDHYIKLGNLKILESYLQLASNKLNESQDTFNSAMDIFMNYGQNNIYVLNLSMCYYIYFSTKFNNHKDHYMALASNIAESFNLTEHFHLYINLFINKNFRTIELNAKSYVLNLITLLSEERKNVLFESKKARDFELVQDFSNKIGLIFAESKLFSEAQRLFNKYFLSKGFAVINHRFNEGFNTIIELQSESETDISEVKEFLENFIISNDLALKSHGKEYDIFNSPAYSQKLLNSMIVYYLYDEITSSIYFFILFYDKKSNWLFSKEDANVGLVLIKNLFLKLKTIHYTEKIKTSSLVDHATGLYNAKYLWNTLNNYIRQYKSKSLNFCMAVMDLNGFKKINDTLGHYAGDEAIKFFSKVLKLSLDANNHIIRYGGDEFVIIFPDFDKGKALEQILKVKSLCAKQPFVFNSSSILLDFSYGIETYNENLGGSKTFFACVDKLMYQNKINHKSKS